MRTLMKVMSGKSGAIISKIGPIFLHGGHQVAVKYMHICRKRGG